MIKTYTKITVKFLLKLINTQQPIQRKKASYLCNNKFPFCD